MSPRNAKNDWNEPELKRHLGPVQAPEELWIVCRARAQLPT